ncbi:UNVERIFIED_CONTAM: Dscam2 [Trichonephila clavipes]
MSLLFLSTIVILISGIFCQEPPVIQPFSFPEYSTVDQTVIVTCAVGQGTKPLEFSWSKNGKEIENVPNTSVHTLARFSVLTVGPASRENVGNYTCTVKNSFGKDSYTVPFVLNEPPVWIQKPQDVRVTENDFLEIICKAFGHPGPKVSWIKINDSKHYFCICLLFPLSHPSWMERMIGCKSGNFLFLNEGFPGRRRLIGGSWDLLSGGKQLKMSQRRKNGKGTNKSLVRED